MIRSRTVNTIHELSAQGKSIQDIAITLGIARNTVRKYLRHPELVAMPHPRPNRGSKLDPFKEQIVRWMKVDHCYNCEAMLPRLLAMGYTGSLSVLKAFVHPLRPPAQGHYPVVRYETEPGKQVQFDWGEFKYEQDGAPRKLYGFTAILCYSRMRFVTFVKRCDAPTMIRCLMEAFEYFGGLPKVALTDRMKSVLLEMEGKVPRWNPLFADFVASIGRLTPGASASMPGCIAPPTNGPENAVSASRFRCCLPLLPGNASRPKNAKSAGMATSPTMVSCTGCRLSLRWPEVWCRCVSGM